MYHAYAKATRGQKRVLEALELELYAVGCELLSVGETGTKPGSSARAGQLFTAEPSLQPPFTSF